MFDEAPNTRADATLTRQGKVRALPPVLPAREPAPRPFKSFPQGSPARPKTSPKSKPTISWISLESNLTTAEELCDRKENPRTRSVASPSLEARFGGCSFGVSKPCLIVRASRSDNNLETRRRFSDLPMLCRSPTRVRGGDSSGHVAASRETRLVRAFTARCTHRRAPRPPR